MKVSPLSPLTSSAEQDDVPHHDDLETTNNCLKRRRLHSQTNIIINGHYRHRKHHYSRHDDKSSSMDCFDTISDKVNGNSSCNSSNSGEEVSDCDDLSMPPNSHPSQQHLDGETSLPSPNNNKKDDSQQTTVINNNNYNNEGDCITSLARNSSQEITTNIDNEITLSLSTHSENNNDSKENKSINGPKILSNPTAEHKTKLATIDEKCPSTANTDFDDPAVTVNDCINSETSNDDCMFQSPLNLTRSQGSSNDGGNKSEIDDEGEYDDDTEEKNSLGTVNNENENTVNGQQLSTTTEAPFPWNVTSNNINKQKQQHQDDKIAAPPQLLLTSGQLTTGCLQAAQLLIPTARGIMTQTILAIPINDMASSANAASNQQQLQQQLLYHSSNNVRQKNINRHQLNQSSQQPLPLALNRYFQQHLTTTDDATATNETPDHANDDSNNHNTNTANNGTTAADYYNNMQRRKWQSSDLTSKKHNFLSPQQKLFHRTKNGDGCEQRSKDSSVVQTTVGINGDNRIYLNNSATTITSARPMSPFTQRRANNNHNNNGGTVDSVLRQSVWPTAVTTTDQRNEGDENINEDDKQQLHQPTQIITPTPPISSTNINTLKSLAQPPSQLNCHLKQSKDGDSASTSAAAVAAAAAYSQQNAICTALATHMLCASQLAAAQQPMFDNMENSNAVKKPNHVHNNNNNNNNNNIKTNNMMGAVNPAVLEKWMMEERYYYNNNNSKNIGGGHNHHQRYNAAAAAAAAAAAVELLSGGVSASASSGGDNLASCKKRKRRTSFTPHALELLNGHFERNTHPSGSEITGLAHRLGYEREVIRIWFCNKRQALKNTVRTINGSSHTHMTGTKSHNHTIGY